MRDKGEKVVADIKGNLNIASLQDMNDYTAKNQSAGIGFSTGANGGANGSLSKGKTDSNYQSVAEQAGIFAGKEGFDITVGKNTDLKGAVIASDATPDKNKLSTDTLTYSDIKNKAEYSASSSGLSISTGKDGKLGLPAPNIGVPVSGDADSTTKSAVSPGTIEVRSNPNQDLSKLSRDPSGSLNALGKIFDKKSVEEKQELANLFGQEAYKAVGDFALKEYTKAVNDSINAKTKEEYDDAIRRKNAWAPGGSNEVALHALVGGIMSDLGGSSFTSGAVGAGVSESVRGQLQNLSPELQQWGSAIIGGVASSLVGGNVQTGSSTALSGTVNNALNHDQQVRFVSTLGKAIQSGSSAEIALVMADYAALDQVQSWIYNDTGAEAETIKLMNSAAQKLGINFGYNENDSLNNNFVAFRDAYIANVQTVDSATLLKAGAVATITIGGVVLFKQNGALVRVTPAVNPNTSGQGFNTFNQLKNYLGLPGTGNHWHHIVEQSQITKSGFNPTQINNTSNVIAVNGATHAQITGYYNSIQYFSNGMRVRDWLAGQSFEAQYKFGMETLKMYGVIK